MAGFSVTRVGTQDAYYRDLRPHARLSANRSKTADADRLRGAAARRRRCALERLELLLAIDGCPEPGVEARRLLAAGLLQLPEVQR